MYWRDNGDVSTGGDVLIQSDTLPQDAVDYLNRLGEVKNEQARQIGRIGARAELLAWCVQWYTASRTWRKQSFEDDWLSWQRNADGRYDPRLAQKKKDWQSKAFVDITPSHRETIQSELFRLLAGSRPIVDVTPRPGGDPEQAENIRDIILRSLERTSVEIELNKGIEDKTTYGSAFYRYWYDEQYLDRDVRVPVYEQASLSSPGSIIRKMRGTPAILGYQNQTQKVCTYRGFRLRHISIWDFFPDPKALGMDGSPCAFRSWITLQSILDQVKSGVFMPESAMVMSERASLETQPPDKSLLQMERSISDVAPRREGNQRTWEYYELFGRLPQKWVYPLLSQPLDVTDAEKLVPARVIFCDQTIFAVELNKSYTGDPPFLKDDYFVVAGRYYGRGIPEMLKNPQMVVNEVVNQRLDEGNLALQEGYAVNEKAIVNTEDLEAGGPGLVVRMNPKALGPNGDVRNAILPLGRPDVKINAGFNEVHEWERMAQERTSVNRAEHGTTPLPGGAKTLGGMQMLKNTAAAKFAYIAMVSEFGFLNKLFRVVWETEYSNMRMDDVLAAIGPDRASRFVLMTPEEVDTAYKYEPKGIFEREAKSEKQARLAALHEQFKGLPGIDDMAFFDEEAKSFGIDPSRLKIPQAQMQFLQAQAQQMAMPMAKQMVAEIVIGQAVKDVERNLAEKMADTADGAKQKKVAGVPDLADKKEPEGKI